MKACIARRVRSGTFPDKNLANAAYSHDLQKLASLAGLQADLKKRNHGAFAANWTTVLDWNEQSRYESKSELEAKDLLAALTSRKHGVLPWVRANW